MDLSLVGMSGIGKSRWARFLKQLGWQSFSSDDYIEQQLDQILTDQGFSGIADVAHWLGQPWEPQHQQNAQTYLDYEAQSIQHILSTTPTKVRLSAESPTLNQSSPRNTKYQIPNTIIDTTGSVIYLPDHTLTQLKSHTTVIYLETPQQLQDQMLQLYLAEPKPVIWGNSYQPKKGETHQQTLARCYPKLLQYRTQKYQQLADITIDYHTLRQPGFAAQEFLNLVEQKISASSKLV